MAFDAFKGLGGIPEVLSIRPTVGQSCNGRDPPAVVRRLPSPGRIRPGPTRAVGRSLAEMGRVGQLISQASRANRSTVRPSDARRRAARGSAAPSTRGPARRQKWRGRRATHRGRRSGTCAPRNTATSTASPRSDDGSSSQLKWWTVSLCSGVCVSDDVPPTVWQRKGAIRKLSIYYSAFLLPFVCLVLHGESLCFNKNYSIIYYAYVARLVLFCL